MLNPIRAELLISMDRHWRRHGQWPSVRTLCSHVRRSTGTVIPHLQQMAAAGYLKYDPYARPAYAIRPADELRRRGLAMPSTGTIPVIGVLRSSDGLVTKPVRPCAPSPEEFAQAVADAVAQAHQDLESGEMYQP